MNRLIFVLIFYSRPIFAEPERSMKPESEAADRPGLIIPTLTPKPTTKTTKTTTTKDCTSRECEKYFIWDEKKCECECGAEWFTDGWDGIIINNQYKECRCDSNKYWDEKERTHAVIVQPIKLSMYRGAPH